MLKGYFIKKYGSNNNAEDHISPFQGNHIGNGCLIKSKIMKDKYKGRKKTDGTKYVKPAKNIC